eukprot:gene22560-34523_t
MTSGIHFGLDIDHPPLGTPMPPRPKGREKVDVKGYPLLDDALAAQHAQELDFVCIPLMETHNFEPFGRSARLLKVTSWCSMVVGKASQWSGDTVLDCDSPDQDVADFSSEVLKKEIAYATHSTLPAVMLELPTKPSPNLARILLSTLLRSMYLNIWIRVPLLLNDTTDPNDNRAWLSWNTLRSYCNNHSRLHVILDMTENLPKPEILSRWVAEPIRGLTIDTALFTFGADTCSLPPAHHDFLMLVHRHKQQIIFKGTMHPRLAALGLDLRYHKNYVVNAKNDIVLNPQEQEESSFYDYLQAPLQPLMDNLESQTYEVFEKDPVKYKEYERASAKALFNLKAKFPGRQIVVMVVGAGRGPLVKAALDAARQTGTDVKVYAVEKNPNAVVTLKGLIRLKEWNDKVEIVECDMRAWQAPEPADLMISELLGSFGDNELSPECLDGAERFLRKGDGIMIPQSYRSYLAPLQSHKLHTDVLAYDDLTHIETAYVVKIHSGYLISDAQQCFEYVHPKPAAPYPQTNDRRISLEFQVQEDALCHGFAGYFDATLYEDVMISIHPKTYSDGMFSWFPIYFPVKTPMLVRKGDTVTAVFWRVTGSGK